MTDFEVILHRNKVFELFKVKHLNRKNEWPFL